MQVQLKEQHMIVNRRTGKVLLITFSPNKADSFWNRVKGNLSHSWYSVLVPVATGV